MKTNFFALVLVLVVITNAQVGPCYNQWAPRPRIAAPSKQLTFTPEPTPIMELAIIAIARVTVSVKSAVCMEKQSDSNRLIIL